MAVTYDLRRSPEGTATWTVIASDVTADYLIDSGLADDAGYDYQIRACNEWGCSDWSTTVNASIPDESDPPAISYDLRRSLKDQNDWTIIASDLTLTAYLDELLSSSTGYDYQVRACNEWGCSDWSATVTVTTPIGPLEGASIGVGVSTGTLTNIVPRMLAGESVGIGASTGTLTVDTGVNLLVGDSVGTGVSTGTLHVVRNLSSASVGIGDTTGAVSIISTATVELVGASVGVGASAGTLSIIDTNVLLLEGASVGVGVTSGGIHMDVRLRGRSVGEGSSIHKYTGPGTGIIAGDEIDIMQRANPGDSFPVHLPWAGLYGMSGLARILSVEVKGSVRTVDAQFIPMPDERLIPGLAKGEPVRYTQPQQNDPWTLTRENQREIRRLKRERGRS